MPGPSLGYLGSTQTSQNPQYARGPITVVTQPPGTEAEESTRDEQSRTHVPSENTMHYSGYDVNPVNCGSSRLDGHSLAYDSAPESRNQPIITVRGIDLDMARWSSVMVQDGTKTEIGTSTARTNFTELKKCLDVSKPSMGHYSAFERCSHMGKNTKNRQTHNARHVRRNFANGTSTGNYLC